MAITVTDSSNASPSQLAQLADKVRQFSAAVTTFLNLKDVPADMRDEYKTIANRLGIIDRAVKVALGGTETIAKWVGLGNPALIVPMALYASVLGGLALGYKLASDFTDRYNKRREDAARIATESGVPYATALQQAGATGTDGFFNFGGKYVLPILAIGAAWFLFGRKR